MGIYSNVERLARDLPAVAPDSHAQLDSKLRLFNDGRVEVWYAPLGYINTKAKLAIFGITPGWKQMQIAYAVTIATIQDGINPKMAHRMRKPGVAFAGSMRRNLVSMLDELGLHKYMDVESTAELFGSDQLHTGSVLKYPVFVNGKNYTGHSPRIDTHPALREMLEQVLAPDLMKLRECLLIPLGKAAESALKHVTNQEDAARIVFGFPHPSGANGHRIRHFQERKRRFRRQFSKWFSS